MMNFNFIGNLSSDVDLRSVNTNGGAKYVANFDVAVNEGFGDSRKTTFIRVSAWGTTAENCAKYLTKGKKVYIAGSPRVNAYINKDGAAVGTLEVSANEVEFLSPVQ